MAEAFAGVEPRAALAAGRSLGAGNFVAIDFETATRWRSSACSIGAAVVEQGSVVDTQRWLIRPPDNEYESINISIHGIAPRMTADSPGISVVWPEVLRMIDERPVVAHYAPFDIGVLKASLALDGATWPTLTYVCTRALARRAWPGWLSYRLDDVAHACGITFQHHEAGSDADAAASLGIAYCGATGRVSILDACTELGMLPGRLQQDGWSPCAPIHPASHHGDHEHRINYSTLRPTVEELPEVGPFVGKTVVFTGTLAYFVRSDAAQHVIDAGGRVANSISHKIDYLVCGIQDAHKVRDGVHSSKMLSALQLKSEGAAIEIPTDDDFYRMLTQ
jgi:DNA polymerase-3 subunit epsilon